MGKVIVKQLKDLKGNPQNPRKISDEQLENLKKSLDAFGDLSGFVFNRRTNQLIGAHQRAAVSPKDAQVYIDRKFNEPTKVGTVAEGWIEIDGERHKYREVDVDEQREKAMNIAANKHGGEFDMPKLTEWLLELDAHNVDLNVVGFTDAELEEIMAPVHGNEGFTDADAVPEVPKEAKTKRGELWTLGAHRVLCGDATDKADVERLMAGEKAEFCFTSPPYSDQRDYGGGIDLSPSHLAKFLSAPCDLFAVNLGLKRSEGALVPYWDDYGAVAKANGLKLLSWNVWDRSGFGYTVGQATAMFTIDHEWIFVWGAQKKDLNRTIPNKQSGLAKKGTVRENSGSTRAVFTETGARRQLGTVIRMDVARYVGDDHTHPAMFPVALPEAYIEACSVRDGKVFEPFTGSGSTLIACEKTGRKCFGMEIEPLYISVILDRWCKFTGKEAYRLNDDGTKTAWSDVKNSSEDSKVSAHGSSEGVR